MSAYNGAAPMIESKEVLGAAGSIVQVEARHAAALRFLGGMNPTLGAFDKPLDEGRGPEGRQAADQGLRSTQGDSSRPDHAPASGGAPAAKRSRCGRPAGRRATARRRRKRASSTRPARA